jgi:hypothetical protein
MCSSATNWISHNSIGFLSYTSVPTHCCIAGPQNTFPTESRHIYGYKLCPSSCRLVLSFVRDRLSTGAWHEKKPEKKLHWSFNFKFCYIYDVLLNENIEIISFVVICRSYPTITLNVEVNIRSSCMCSILHCRLSRLDVINKSTKLKINYLKYVPLMISLLGVCC